MIDEIDALTKTPYYENLKKELEGIEKQTDVKRTVLTSQLGFSLSYPAQWIPSEKKNRIEFFDPSLRLQGFANAVASVQLLDVDTREEAVKSAFFVEENGLYFAIGRLGRKGDPAVAYVVRGKEVLVGDTAVAVFDADGAPLGLSRNFRALVSDRGMYVIINVLESRKLLDEIVASIDFIN
ncbi:MAG: hypothetical protein G01um101470_495 [Parcubacteria group bacterium Gr01-1014_70]|nr:MAG: hypothetical protein G01um101470_495 [Parcubacteria group bacterium Gr01-1014_70]